MKLRAIALAIALSCGLGTIAQAKPKVVAAKISKPKPAKAKPAKRAKAKPVKHAKAKPVKPVKPGKRG